MIKQVKDNKNTNVVSIFKPSDNSIFNLESFLKTQKKTFGYLFEGIIEWNSYTWNIKGFESTISVGKANQKKNIIFSQFNGEQITKIKTAKDDEKPFLEPFQSFVKAHITYRHNAKCKTKDNHMVIIRGYRYLYNELPNDNKSIGLLTKGHFDRAAKAALVRESESSAYRLGVALGEIEKLLNKFKLTPMGFRWKNPIPRKTKSGGEIGRNTKESEYHRAKMLPKTDVLIYLAALWEIYNELEENDKPLLCITIIMMFSGLRIDEVLGLDTECTVTDFEYNHDTGKRHKVMKIRVLAKKSGQWNSKKVPFSAQETIDVAINRLKKSTENHRKAASLLLEDGKYHKLSHLDNNDLLDKYELSKLTGITVSNVSGVLKNHGVEISTKKVVIKNQKARSFFRVGDIHTAILNEFKNMYPDIVKGFGNSVFRLPLWEHISLQFKGEFSSKGVPQWYPIPISQNVIQDFLRGRDYKTRETKKGGNKDARIESIFERYSIDHIDGADLSVHSHQFRHLLNTIMQESDVFGEHEIARYFLRNKIGDNATYNHQQIPSNYIENSQKNISNVLAKLNVTSNQAKEARKLWPTLSFDDILDDLDEIGCAHSMDIGVCQHDYSQTPCEKHYQCLRQCRSYRRKKGDQDEINFITKRRDETKKQLEFAQEDMADEFYGANKWVTHHHALLDGCNKALSIEKDDRYQVGDMVVVFPDGSEFCKVEL